MLTEEQQVVRARGIFATDIARIMTGHGVQVTLEKLGEIKREDIGDEPAVQLGNLLEAPLLKAFVDVTGLECERSPKTQMHPTIEWLGAHPDAMGMEGRDGFTVEGKAWNPVARQQFGDPGTDEVPDYVLWQSQAQLAVTGFARTYVPVCFTTPDNLVKYLTRGEVDVLVYVVPRSEKLIERLIAHGEHVWRCVQERRLPEPAAVGDARLIYRQDNAGAVNGTTEIARLHERLMTVRLALKKMADEQDTIKDQLQRHMGEAAELYYQGRLLATWKKARDGQAFDEKAFAAQHPAMYREFMRPTIGSRRFLPKGD